MVILKRTHAISVMNYHYYQDELHFTNYYQTVLY